MNLKRKLLWEPSEEWISNANITRFIEFINKEYIQDIKTAKELYQWSVDDISCFWESIWRFCGNISSKGYERIVEDLSIFPGTKWFSGTEFNFAENLLRFKDDRVAFFFQGETRVSKQITYAELNIMVARLAKSLREIGVKPGDRVVSYIPNLIETPIAMLAATAIGATWASCGAELQSSAVIDRFGQIEPKVIFTVDGYFYKDNIFEMEKNIQDVVKAIPSLEKVVVVSYVSDGKPDISKIQKSVHWDEFLSEEVNPPLEFEQLPFDHPVYIMFSSGTTGKPKCMVQGSGGVLLKHQNELVLSVDLKRSDTINYITAPSWMMWNWLQSSLSVGATILLYDGNPLYPHPLRMFELVEKYKVSIFGVSATFIHKLLKDGEKPSKEFDLGRLREIIQTGSGLSPEGFEYIHKSIKKDLYFNSISGGTDINGCFAAAIPIMPVYSNELQCRALGLKVEAYNENGESIRDQQGELVCENPGPSMPLYFWADDANMSKYKAAYFDFFKDFGKNVWRHGDWITINSDRDSVSFWGRSDATLKPSGVRIGTAEIYNIVEEIPEIKDSLVIGLPNKEGDVNIVLFIDLSENMELTDKLKIKIRKKIKDKTSPRHVPAKIIEVPADTIPYTFSGKKVEIAITRILRGMKATNRGALRNPDSLDFYNKLKNIFDSK